MGTDFLGFVVLPGILVDELPSLDVSIKSTVADLAAACLAFLASNFCFSATRLTMIKEN